MSTSPFMRAAIEASQAVRGTTSPNPWVGAVVVRDGAVVATGATEPPGGRHAEAVALAAAGEARGAEVYVTLEPCFPFEGKRTPPCSAALIEAGVGRVVIALEDPDAQVAGRGIAALRAAGIAVEVGDGAGEARELLRPYLKHRQTGRPYVIAKWATSLDGRLGGPGTRWLTSERARARVHEDRAIVDAILVGVGTVLADDPALTARPGGVTAARQPLRVVVDSKGRTPATAAVLSGPGRAVLAVGPQASAAWRATMVAAGAQVIELEDTGDGLDLEQLLTVLGQRGVMALIVEGGAMLLGSFIRAELADEVHAYVAPLLLGAAGPAIHTGPFPLRLEDVRIEPLDPDVLVRGYTGAWEPGR